MLISNQKFFWAALLAQLVVALQGAPQLYAEAFATTVSVPSGFDEGQQVFSQAAIETADVSAAAEALLGQANLSPILKARSRLIDQSLGASASAIAAALEGYTYLGTTTTTIQYNFTITGDVSTPVGAARDSSIRSFVEFLIAPTLEANFTGDIDNILQFIQFQNTTEFLGDDSAELSGNVVGGVANGSVSFSVDPGDTFYMFADLFADSYSFSASADAFSTFTGSFVDASQLRAASNTIPEPSSLLLMALATTGLLCRQGR